MRGKFVNMSAILASISFISVIFMSLISNNAMAFSFDSGFSGKLALTQGVSQIEGSAGGGITPWALIAGCETSDQVGASAFGTALETQNFSIVSKGVAIGLFDRVELSYAHLSINTESVGEALGLGPDFFLTENIFGVKIKVFGDAVKDQDVLWPQIAIGAQFKRNSKGSVPYSLGATSANGVDFYAAFTKLFLDQSVLADLTIRATQANQLGLLGFGGTQDNNYQIEFEGSLGYLFTPHLLAGGEYRQKPDNIASVGSTNLEEDSYKDLFAAWAPTKNLSLTLAYVWLGDVATQVNQRGPYISVQAGF